MRVLLSRHEAHEARGDVESVVDPAVHLRVLQARGAAMPMCAPPDCAEWLAHIGVSLALVAPIGHLVRPLVTMVTMVTGVTPPPQLAGERCDALVKSGVMPDGGWQ